jgi:flavin-dependent thymidylate synthase
MDVQLIRYTQDAEDLLIFTKNTRLNMTQGDFSKIVSMTQEEKLAQLEYMANTIPSSWEFVDYVFIISGVSRAFTHQFVRTRTGSFAQQSMRVTDMGDFEYVSTARTNNGKHTEDYIKREIQVAYLKMIKQGETLEDARGILPTNIATNIVAKFNLRTMSELARSRTGGRTQGEYRTIMGLMCDEIIKVHPWAELFLFPKGRDHFKDLEEAVAKVSDWDTRAAILKVIDKMRKN